MANKAEAERIFNYPYEAIEEALVNAVYHRSYEIAGAHRGSGQSGSDRDSELPRSRSFHHPEGSYREAFRHPPLSKSSNR